MNAQGEERGGGEAREDINGQAPPQAQREPPVEKLQAELAALSLESLRAEVPLGALAEEGHLRLFQWNVSDFTVGGDEAIFAERLANLKDCILAQAPDVGAIEEVKAGDNGRRAWERLMDELAPHYVGKLSGLAVGARERVGFFWRKKITTLAKPEDAELARLTTAKVETADAGSENYGVLGVATQLGLQDAAAVAEHAEKAWLRGRAVKTWNFSFTREAVLLSLPLHGGGRVHVLAGHLDTVKNGEQNRSEVAVLRLVASAAWDQHKALALLLDANSDECKHSHLWSVPGVDEEAGYGGGFKELGVRAIAEDVSTNVYPFLAGIRTGSSAPAHNDEIFLPKELCSEGGRGWTVGVAARALAAWGAAAPRLARDNAPAKSINLALSKRFSDHLPCVAEMRRPPVLALLSRAEAKRMNMPKLKVALEARALEVTGQKKDLVNRLIAHLA